MKAIGFSDNALIMWQMKRIGMVVFAGIILGVLLSLGQLHFEWITLGNGDGSFLIDAYPISIRVLDLIVILITVFLVSIVSTWFPVYYLTHRLIWKEHEAKAGGGSSEE